MTKKYNAYRDLEYKRKRSATPKNAATALISAYKWKGLTEKMEKYEFTLKWSEIVSEEIASYSKPSHFRGDTLVLKVPSSAHAQQLSFVKLEIIDALRPYLKSHTKLKDIAFEVGRL